MIRTISALIKITTQLTHQPLHHFCSKTDTLKTYLEIIPPHRIYELREKKEHRVEHALLNLEQQEVSDGRWVIN